MEDNHQNPYAGIYGNGGSAGGTDGPDQNDSKQSAGSLWRNIASSKWLTYAIVAIILVIGFTQSCNSKESVISFATDDTSIGVVTPNYSVVFDIASVDSWYRTAYADWDVGTEINCYKETSNTIESEYRRADLDQDYDLIIYPSSPDIIVIHYNGNQMVVFNGKTADETNEWYNELLEKVGEPTAFALQD